MLADIFSEPQNIRIKINGCYAFMKKVNDELWKYNDVCVTLEKSDVLGVYIEAWSSLVECVEIIWIQNIENEIRILGDSWERGYGDLEWRGLDIDRILPWYFSAFYEGHTFGYGVETQPNAMCYWKCNSYHMSVTMDIRSGGAGVDLAGRKLLMANLISAKSELMPFEATREFCKRMCKERMLPKNPVYGGNDWYCNYGNNSFGKIIEHTKIISQCAMSKDNRPFMVVDDGWQLCHGGQTIEKDSFNGGPWNSCNSNFRDMSELAYDITLNNAIPGLWFRPLYTMEKTNDSLLLKRPSKHKIFDPSNKDAIEKVKEDIETFVDWGYKLIKHDFSTFDIFGRWGFCMGEEIADEGWSFYDNKKTTAEIIKNFYKAIKEAAKDTIIIGCNTIGHLSAGIFEIQRTGDDTSGIEWSRTRKMGINTLAFKMPQHNIFFASDADCVGITNAVPWTKNQKWLDILSKSSTPLFVSIAEGALGKEQENAVRKAFEIASVNKEIAVPQDWMYNICPSVWRIGNEIVQYDWA